MKSWENGSHDLSNFLRLPLVIPVLHFFKSILLFLPPPQEHSKDLRIFEGRSECTRFYKLVLLWESGSNSGSESGAIGTFSMDSWNFSRVSRIVQTDNDQLGQCADLQQQGFMLLGSNGLGSGKSFPLRSCFPLTFPSFCSPSTFLNFLYAKLYFCKTILL